MRYLSACRPAAYLSTHTHPSIHPSIHPTIHPTIQGARLGVGLLLGVPPRVELHGGRQRTQHLTLTPTLTLVS